MVICVSGATGLIGSALVPFLEARGHQVISLRRQGGAQTHHTPTWNPSTGDINLSQVGRLDAFVHLAGEPIAQRWTPAAKARIRSSRVEATRCLCESLARLPTPPQVLVCASAIGYYGDRAEALLNEHSAPGEGFLATTCRDWELATEAATDGGVRVVRLRLGLVLAPRGGALARMLPAFRFGLGGNLGSGQQWWSWIALEDLLRAVQQALETEDLRGPVNAVAPSPVTNADFTRQLAAVLKRPAFLSVPAFLVKLLFGEMGAAVLLASARVIPQRLQETHFAFQQAELTSALERVLKGNVAPRS